MYEKPLNNLNYDKNQIHLSLEFTYNIQPSKLINNIKTVSSKLTRKNILLI
ncbi:transposase (plasmid) [Borreliella californiensis]|uniref:Transposase n=1 Tax=Borreliella californiensis TaxID=373543 RepID=A0ABZ3JD55_9SPIR